MADADPRSLDELRARPNPALLRGITFREDLDDEEFTISAVRAGKDIGWITISLGQPLFFECESRLEALRQMVGKRVGLGLVYDSFVYESMRRKGVGVALYRAAAKVASRDYDSAIAWNECGGEGETSPSAKRLWRSRELTKGMIVVGAPSMGMILYAPPVSKRRRAGGKS